MKQLLPAALLLCACNLTAQNQLPPIVCGNSVLEYKMHEHFPEMETAFRETFDQAKAAQNPVADRTPYTVNVVFHVVWKFPEENLPDSVILNQLQVLNEDYNRLNADTGNLRAVFQPFAGSPNIQFNLAGIERVQTNADFTINLFDPGILPNLKSSASGGSDAWDPNQYLNIWICNIRPFTIGGVTLAQILGFAFPPVGLSNWPPDVAAPTPGEDGVALDYHVVGRNNPNPLDDPSGTGTLVVRGRTATHEVGHYLGLRHIWGDGGVFGPNACDQSDGIDDTPFANSQTEFNCDITRNTCPNIEPPYGANVPDMIENYMDYASEDCMNTFTAGQAMLMRSVLEGPRNGLLQPIVSTQEISPALTFGIYPNPATSSIVLRFEKSLDEPVQASLIDASGRMVKMWTNITGSPELSLVGVPTGLYAIHVVAQSGSAVKKLVVK
ncbi:MAG: T9SS type A sorting domain-containing protein [Saprospiraceae bacterium]|nr:T9SS type A sorting domain-containing protein [Saprospiraceae bacterium]